MYREKRGMNITKAETLLTKEDVGNKGRRKGKKGTMAGEGKIK